VLSGRKWLRDMNTFRSRIITFLCIAVTIAGALYLLRSPAASARLRVPPEFDVQRVAGPDLTSYPMMGTVDDRGRLFLCESSGNTKRTPEMIRDPDYTIRMLEDRDGDGVYDRASVFAEKLTLPAGAVWHHGSLYVAAPPDLIRFADLDNDGKAEVKEVVVTGWNLSANAASLHGPIFGPDGYLYLTDGRHGFDIKTKDGRAYKGLGSRIWRVRPDGTGLEWLAGGGFDNPVEVAFTSSGETIGTMTYFKDPENGERDALLHFVEGGVYPKWYSVVSEFKRTGDLMPVMTKFARIAPSGLMRYRSAVFGNDHHDSFFSAQFNPHRVQRHVVFREGATFRTEDSDFLTSTDPDFHPTDVFEDADGSVLVLDTGAWFIHGCPLSQIAKPEVKGGVYRIRKKGTPAVRDPRGDQLNIASMQPRELGRLLEDSRPFVQDRATEQLVQAGDAAVATIDGVRQSSRNYEARAAAVFALFRIGTPRSREAVRAALNDSDFRVRTAAARCAGMAGDRDAVGRLTAIAAADHPAARRQAAAALGQIGDSRAVEALLATAASSEDRFTEHSIIYSLIQLGSPGPLHAALRDAPPPVRKAALIALDQMDGSRLRSEDVAPFLAAPEKELRLAGLFVVSHHPEWAHLVGDYLNSRLQDAALPKDEVEPVRDALRVFIADPEIQGRITGWLGDLRGELQTGLLLDAIEESPLKEIPSSWIDRIGMMLESGSPNIRQRAVEMVRARSIPGLEDQLTKITSDSNAPDALRASALSVLVGRNPKFAAAQYEFLTSRLEAATDPVLRQTVARIIGRSAPPKDRLLQIASRSLAHADPLVMSSVLDCFRSTTDEEVGRALISVLEQSPAALGTLGEDRLKALFAAYPASVQGRAIPLFRRLEDAQKARLARLRQLEPLLTASGDAGRGRRIFFGPKVACASCHTIGMEGAQVGPDLTGIGAIRSGHDLLEAIVFPSASFVPGHEVFNVDLGHDRLSGVIRSQNRDAVVLVTGPNGEFRIPRRDIKSIQASKVSLMPEGFDESLTKTELTDLLTFLQAEKARPKPSGSAR
jgi:putative membrane-bound dehydrogenase-like protein